MNGREGLTTLIDSPRRKRPAKPRITIEPEHFADGTPVFVFRVRFPGDGWKTRQCLSWGEALFAAGLRPLKDPR